MSTVSRLILLLDSSGSMSSQHLDVIGGINETITKQREAFSSTSGDIMFTVITFNNTVSEPKNSTLANIPLFTNLDYKTSGGTALYDGICTTIDKYGLEHNVIFLIMTDGRENSSKFFSFAEVVENLDKVKEDKNWRIIYLSEGLETFKQGEALGIHSGSKNCYNVISGGGNLGSYLKGNACQNAITQMMCGSSNVQLSSSEEKKEENREENNKEDSKEKKDVKKECIESSSSHSSFSKSTSHFFKTLSNLNPLNIFKKSNSNIGNSKWCGTDGSDK